MIADEAHVGRGPLLNVTIGALDGTVEPFAVIIKLHRAPTGKRMAECLWEALRHIWPTDEEIREHQSQIRILITDGAVYNKTASDFLKNWGLSRLLHVICLVHGINLVCGVISKRHSAVLSFVSRLQSTYHMSPQRQAEFKGNSNHHFDSDLIKLLFTVSTDSGVDLKSILNNPANPKWDSFLGKCYLFRNHLLFLSVLF